MAKNFLGKCLSFFSQEDDSYEDYSDESSGEEVAVPVHRDTAVHRVTPVPKQRVYPLASASNGANISGNSSSSHQVVVFKLGAVQKVQREVADSLKSGKIVIVNLQGSDAETRRRTVDFLEGHVYALNGKRTDLGDNIFLYTSGDVDVKEMLRFQSDSRSDSMDAKIPVAKPAPAAQPAPQVQHPVQVQQAPLRNMGSASYSRSEQRPSYPGASRNRY